MLLLLVDMVPDVQMTADIWDLPLVLRDFLVGKFSCFIAGRVMSILCCCFFLRRLYNIIVIFIL